MLSSMRYTKVTQAYEAWDERMDRGGKSGGVRWNCGTHAGGQGKGQPLGTEGTWMEIPDRAQGNWRCAGSQNVKLIQRTGGRRRHS